jgi:hypothetical protein
MPPYETGAVILVFAQKKWSIEMKYVEKGIIIEDVDRWSMWTVAHKLCLLTRQEGETYLCRWDSPLNAG